MLRVLAPAAVLVLFAALLGGCGGDSNTSNGNNSTSGSNLAHTSPNADQRLAMATCMRAHGVPSFPDSPANGGPIGISAGPGGTVTIGGAAVAQTTLRAAFQKCQSKAPQGPPLSAAQIAGIRRGALRMAECMRAHGVSDFPDPQISTGPGGHGIGIRIGIGLAGVGGEAKARGPELTRSPAFESAQQTCMPLMQRAIGKNP